MIGLNAFILVDGNWVDASSILSNDTGTPVVSADANFSGRSISDSYVLEFSSVVPVTSAVVKVACGSSSNPYNDQVGVSVALDGATVYSDIVPGIDLVFSDDGGFTGSWQATVVIGSPFGRFNAFPPDSGDPSDGVRVKVVNSGADDGSACRARLLPVLKPVKRTGVVLDSIHAPAEGATEKLVSDSVAPYALNATGVAGIGPAKTMDIDVDGSPFGVINLTDSTTGPSTGLGVVDWYRATDGDLQGMEFKLSEDAAEADTENVLCFSQRFSQLAPDQAGVPGDWATTDVDLTEDGQATGVITASGAAYFWVRVLVVDGGNAKSNPYVIDVAVEGASLLSAGWED